VREQEDEALAKRLQYGFQNGRNTGSVPFNQNSSKRREKKTEIENLCINELDFEQQLLLAQELSLDQHRKEQENCTKEELPDELVTEIIEQQFRELESDKQLAKFLQIEETISCGKNEIDERGLSDLEYKIYKLKFRDNEPEENTQNTVNYSDDDRNGDFVYIEPFDISGPSREHEIEPQLLYDQSQREVDTEISHVYRRDSDKRNSTAVPLHFKLFSTRNKGKFADAGLCTVNGASVAKSQRGKSHTKQAKHIAEGSLNFPIKSENFVYGQVVLLPGAAHCHVQNVVDASVTFCRISGSVKSKTRVNKWDIVLVSVRPYQQSRGDIVYVYNAKEREKLSEMNHLICFDPLLNLTPDCINILMTYFDQEWLKKVGIKISKKWFFIANLLLEETALIWL